jgi:hypothetical protein
MPPTAGGCNRNCRAGRSEGRTGVTGTTSAVHTATRAGGLMQGCNLNKIQLDFHFSKVNNPYIEFRFPQVGESA